MKPFWKSSPRKVPIRGTRSFNVDSGRRKVSVDANVLLAAIVYRSKTMPILLDRINQCDTLIVSNIILFQCTRHANREECTLSEKQIRDAVLKICPDVVEIELLSVEDLRKRYSIRDESDLETLYSVDATGSDIFITGDRDFYDPNAPPQGITARIMRPRDYLKETEGHHGKHRCSI